MTARHRRRPGGYGAWHRSTRARTRAWPSGGRGAARVRLAGYAARTIPWGPVTAGGLAGIGVSVLLRVFAGPAESLAVLTAGVRVAFVPLVCAVAFVPPDAQRLLLSALPGRTAWRMTALRLTLVLPVLTATAAVELALAGRALTIDAGLPPTAAPPPLPWPTLAWSALPWPALAGELAAWCLLAIALAAGLLRTRWHDVAGLAAAASAPGLAGLAGLWPLRLLPAVSLAATGSAHRHWAVAWAVWAATGVAAAAVASWAAGDSWRRWPGRPRDLRNKPAPWPVQAG